MGLISNVASNLAVKKLNGKTHTAANKVLAQEAIGSNVQIGSNIIFGQTPPNNPTQTLFVTSSVVEYLEFDLVPIAGTQYQVTNGTTGDGPATTAQYHGYALRLPTNYVAQSKNSKAGTGYFVDGGFFTGSLGALQIVPVNFSTVDPNPYQPVIYNLQNTLLEQSTDLQDWVLDAYAGTVFFQDPDANMYNINTPTTYSKLRAFVYIGTFLSESIGGNSTQAQSAASASVTTATDNNPYYVTFVSQSSGTHPFKVDADLTYNPSTNVLSTTASWAVNSLTASNITNAYVNQVAAAANQLVFSAGSGNVSGSTQFVVNTTANNNSGSLYIGGTTISGNGVNWVANGSVFNIGTAGGGTQAIVINPTGGANGNGSITFNYSASFTAPTTFVSASNSTFSDQFILLASGSTSAKDSGIVFSDYGINSTLGVGPTLFYDSVSTKRLAYRFTGSVSDLGMDPQAFINMTFVKDPNGSAVWNYNSKAAVDAVIGDKVGFMWLDSNGDIYIKA